MVLVSKWRYDIVGFSRYFVKQPFAIIDRETGNEVKRFVAHRGKRGHERAHLYDDTGKRRTLSIITIAALAYHGQQPDGYVAYHAGRLINQSSVKWLPKRQANRIWRQNFTEWQRLEMCELYFEEGWTQKHIAEKYGLGEAAVSRALRARWVK